MAAVLLAREEGGRGPAGVLSCLRQYRLVHLRTHGFGSFMVAGGYSLRTRSLTFAVFKNNRLLGPGVELRHPHRGGDGHAKVPRAVCLDLSILASANGLFPAHLPAALPQPVPL